MTLYELTDQYRWLQTMVEDPELDEEVLADALNDINGDYNEKIDGYCRIVKNLEADAEALKKEAKRLSERQKSIESRVAWLKARMYESMKAVGVSEAGKVLHAKVQKNGGVLPLKFKEGFGAMDAPEAFRRVEYSFDTQAIRDALDAGGVLDFVEFGERGETVRIK